jgi:hypothetical protein
LLLPHCISKEFFVIVQGQKNQELYIKASCFTFKHYLCRTS